MYLPIIKCYYVPTFAANYRIIYWIDTLLDYKFLPGTVLNIYC